MLEGITMKYKDTSDTVHEIDSKFDYLLPVGSVQLSEVEADILNTPPIPTEQEILDAKNDMADLNNLEPKIKAVILTLIEEINTLRAAIALPVKTNQDYKTSVFSKL